MIIFVLWLILVMVSLKKYDYTSFRQDFKIWFTDLEGNEIKADENLSFILELVLIY